MSEYNYITPEDAKEMNRQVKIEHWEEIFRNLNEEQRLYLLSNMADDWDEIDYEYQVRNAE